VRALVHAHGGAVAPSAKKYLDHIEMRFAEEQARLQRETMDLQRYKSRNRSRDR
jgi:ethanolamine utilization cobalamin adenosyltransferase